LLDAIGVDCSHVVRLDHFTSSQDWLPVRQSVRERYFGKPAPLASTGVAAKMAGTNMVTTCAIALADPADKHVLVDGSRYGMNNISAAVRGGPFVFLSGIRGTVDPRTGVRLSDETPAAFAAQARIIYEVIRSILNDCGLDVGAILRIDTYLRDQARAADDERICREVLRATPCASTRVALPLSGNGDIEATVLAAVPGVAKDIVFDSEAPAPTTISAGGFVFVGECMAPSTGRPAGIDPEAQLRDSLELLDRKLNRCGSGLSRTVRLDLFLRDTGFADAARETLTEIFDETLPATTIVGADLEEGIDVKLNAIAT